MRCNSPWNSRRAACRGRRSARARSEAGFTLIEVLVSALLVALISAAVAQALISTTRTSAEQRGRSQADQVAQQDQERMRGLSAQQLNGLNQVRTVTLDGTAFKITSTAQFLSASGGGTCSGSGEAAYFNTQSSVDWTANQAINRPAVVEKSIITPPAGGTLLTQVNDQTGAPLSGVTVSASGPDTASGVTDASGCTVLSALATGSYAVTLADQGYVDMNANPSPLRRSATVTGSGTATPSGGNPIIMGLAGTISASFTTTALTGTAPNQTSGTLSDQGADAVSWLGTGASTGMSSSNAYGPVPSPVALLPATGTISLFPFAFAGPSYVNNYQVWAGKCRQMQPPTGSDMATVGPASNQTVSVQEPALNVVVTYNGTRIRPDHVRISFTSTSGPACTDDWPVKVASDGATNTNGSLAAPGQPFASTATSGSSASASSYTGTLSVCADYNPPGLSSRTAAVSTANTNFVGATAPPPINLTPTSSAGVCT